jgi:hypothetical protein
MRGPWCVRTSLLIVSILAAVIAPTAETSATPLCTGRDLTAVFAAVPRGATARTVRYSLRLNNNSFHACLVRGQLGLQLLDAKGRALPTRVTVTDPDVLPHIRDVIGARWWGQYGFADFSSDIPGASEQHTGPCQPVAHRLRITLPTGSLTTPIRPPTSVCQHGSIKLTVQVWVHG